METETQKSPSSENLTRKQKVLRRFLPVVLVAGGAAAYGVSELQSNDKESPEASGEMTAHVMARATTAFGGAESDWGHGTAERLIREALSRGVPLAFSKMNTTKDMSSEEIDEIVEELPVFEQADEALEIAGYDDIVPDVGDKMTVTIDVTADSSEHVSYEVTAAQIEDVPESN